MLLIPEVPGHPADPVVDYMDFIKASSMVIPNKPLFMREGKPQVTVTLIMMGNALRMTLDPLELDSSMYSFLRLHHRGTMAAYQIGLHQVEIKWHGLWASDCF